jgi:hypothetical protein
MLIHVKTRAMRKKQWQLRMMLNRGLTNQFNPVKEDTARFIACNNSEPPLRPSEAGRKTGSSDVVKPFPKSRCHVFTNKIKNLPADRHCNSIKLGFCLVSTALLYLNFGDLAGNGFFSL